MIIEIDGKAVEVSEQGYLLDADDWSEALATEITRRDGAALYVDHWELIMYFRDYFTENQKHPSMHTLVRSLGCIEGAGFKQQKQYEKHIYSLFPVDPIHQICKLAGLPMPPPDT